jgi:hypothetical protein
VRKGGTKWDVFAREDWLFFFIRKVY